VKSSKELLVERVLIENYEKYYRLAYSYVHNEADALDIVQEGAYKAMLRCDSLRSEDFVKTWIYRIMFNEILLLYRREGKAVSQKLIDIEEYQTDFTKREEERLMLKEALNRLPDKEKAVIELRYFEDLKLEEIAQVLEENLSTVKSRLYRALEKLKLSMEETPQTWKRKESEDAESERRF
jgi:RNA polymerase sigma-70 factor (ECF subfamily)